MTSFVNCERPLTIRIPTWRGEEGFNTSKRKRKFPFVLDKWTVWNHDESKVSNSVSEA